MSVGGIKYPKHLGQSGQPMPLPVERTILPAAIKIKSKPKVSVVNLIRKAIRFSITAANLMAAK